RLRENSLTPALLHQLITLQHLSVPAGSLESDGVRYTARVGRPLASVEELAQLVIGEAQNPQPTYGMGALVPQVLRLQDVAEVRAVSKPRSGIVRVNGEPALVLQVRAQSGANA